MTEPFIDCTTLRGGHRIRSYVLGWLERLDYSGKLDRGWPAEELGALVWKKVERDFAAVWRGPIVANAPLAEVIATTMVEDYYSAYPTRRTTRFTVVGPLDDGAFRRCVLDFVHDLEEFEPSRLDGGPPAILEAFWQAVGEDPSRWEWRPELGPFVDDEEYARVVALAAVQEYFALQDRAAARDAATRKTS